MLDRKLSLVLPAHNEEANIEAVVNRGLEVLPDVVSAFEIVVVNDGSRDNTGEIIDRMAANDDRVKAVHHAVNRGYGSALTSGFTASTGDLLMFMDADRQFDIADITALMPYVDSYDIVAGYRIERRDPVYRKLYGKLFGLVAWILFGVHMRDVDCAFKIYNGDLLRSLDLTAPGALINTEMLARSRRRGATVTQVGVQHYPRLAGESSGGSPKVVFRAMGETIRLWFTLREDEPVAAAVAQADQQRQRSIAIGALAALLVFITTIILLRGRSS